MFEGVAHVTVYGNDSAVADVPPVIVLVIVSVPGFALSGLVIVAVAPAAIGLVGCTYVAVPHV